MGQPLVHVLVVNWKGRPHLKECFDSLLGGSYPNARFVLIDNASEDGSLEFFRTHYSADPRVDLVCCESNLGWSRANNIGIERALEAGADYIFLLNDDTVTAPDAITDLVAMAENRPEIGALAPKMLLYHHPDLINSIGIECSIAGTGWDLGLGRLDSPKWHEPRKVLGVCGGACFLRAEAVRKAGVLPADFDIYLDDLDLCLRIWDAGYEVWSCPAAVVLHKFSATMGQGDAARRKYFLNTRNRMRLVLRNFPVSKALSIKASFAVAELRSVGRALLDKEFWKVGAHIRAWLANLSYLPKALGERSRRRKAGVAKCRFWPLVRTAPLFFPGVELPEDGWYAEQQVDGLAVRPISTRARRAVQPGRLRVTCVNCYPQLGSTDIEVRLGADKVARLQTDSSEQVVIPVEHAGALEFTARTVFDGDDTGLGIDVGGWLHIEPL
ncbi:MAG: glycosyltransferase family 2 protein [Candidatus Hydrogenedentes bacterium]|nr:glycosyltransferase family 2 protein [Candidatus Hydrogenedentota bacterium]